LLRLDELVVSVPTRHSQVTVCCEVPTGSSTTIFTRPGEGTAIARTVVGLTPALSGRVLVGNRDVSDLPPTRRQIGYIPAGGGLLPHLTVQQNIEYGLRRRTDLVVDLARDWQHTLVSQLEIGSVLNRRPDELSTERRLRVALARAVVGLPEVIIVDLPDPRNIEAALTDHLARIRSSGTPGALSVAVVTPRPALVPQRTPR
jgi:ABC-type sugar transport system ATPase subunit